MMLLKTIIATFATATLFFASLAEGHALSLVPMAAVATLLLAAKESMALTIAQCFSGPDCNGYPHDVTSTTVARVGLDNCGTLRGPLGYGRACTQALCGGSCVDVKDASDCIKGGPFLSYCF